MMELMGNVYDGRSCGTVNICYGLAIAFYENLCWLAICLYQQLEKLTLRGIDYADSR
ncbi:MAG: hypothetical protein V7L04_20195 [Nostoc sp.]|uniref:hypothetical protein n=1 Tax=Nostoc sp. TaxID=1180 RepID=UPI002FFC7D6D